MERHGFAATREETNRGRWTSELCTTERTAIERAKELAEYWGVPFVVLSHLHEESGRKEEICCPGCGLPMSCFE